MGMRRSIVEPPAPRLGAQRPCVFPPFPAPNDAPVALRPAAPSADDAAAFARYLADHVAESGRGGSAHFAPIRSLDRDEVRSAALARWSKGLGDPLWGRAWLLWAGARVAGHLELRGGRIGAEMHRATLGMGLLRAFTGQGHGTALVETAARWAREEAGLAWIDLGVFSNNERARRLYRRMGFVEIGTRREAFRLDSGVAVDDVLMALSLR
jgi:RimJ/RimL family protein N-acetyltransferase